MKIVIAGGGTGGHLFPGIAVAEEWQRQQPEASVLFLCTAKAIDRTILEQTGFTFIPLTLIQLQKSVTGLVALVRSFFTAYRTLRRFAPQLVLGVGGGSSLPTIVAARLQKIPVFLQEQNIIMGKANRWLSPFAKTVFLAYEATLVQQTKKKTTFMVTGNPVRQALLKSSGKQAVFGSKSDVFTLLVLGGSQGAEQLNQAVKKLMVALQKQKTPVRVIHQTGSNQLKAIKQYYKKNNIVAHSAAFIENIGAAYAEADLVISRAGASSLAEQTALGKAMILVPYPFAADNHQLVNARFLEKQGAAICLEDNDTLADKLIKAVSSLQKDPDQLQQIQEASKQRASPQAATEIVTAIRKELIHNHCVIE